MTRCKRSLEYFTLKKNPKLENDLFASRDSGKMQGQNFTRRDWNTESFDRFAIHIIFFFSLNSFVPDARFFAFSSTDYDHREAAVSFWQVWLNVNFTNEDYASFFYNDITTYISRVTPTTGVRTSSRTTRTTSTAVQTSETSVRTSDTSPGKNNRSSSTNFFLKKKGLESYRHSNYIRIL